MQAASTLFTPRLDICNCSSLRKAARRVTQFYDERLATSGLRITQFAILGLCRGQSGITIGELAERMELDRTTTGKNLLPLERAGLIRIEPSPSDRRARAVALTRKGETAWKAAEPLWCAAQREFEAFNGAESAAALRATLARVRVERTSSNDRLAGTLPP